MRGIGAVVFVLAVTLVGTLFLFQNSTMNSGAISTEQVERGALVYASNCASCHGEDLQGGSASGLAGPQALARWVGQSAHDLYLRIRTMPYGMPDSLSDQDYVDALAFILDRNENSMAQGEIAADQDALLEIQLASAGDIPDGAPAMRHRLTTARDISNIIGGGPTQLELTSANSETSDWLFTNHDYKGQRYVDLDQITRANVSRLKPVCMYQVGDLNPFEVNPLIYKGNMFITSRDATVSLDAATCRVNWRYDRSSRVPASYGLKMNRGAAIKDGKLIYGTHDGFLIALDAGTGELLWERDVAYAPGRGGGFTMAPMIHENLIFIGPAGSELGVRGWIGAFDFDTGELVWRFDTIADEGEPGGNSWPNDEARNSGGGAVWGSITLDTETGHLYVPVSNPTPDWEDGTRLGDNLYTCSMVVLDSKTGKLLWYYQLTPHDTHDYDLSQASPQFTTEIDGVRRDLVVSVGKEGLLHVFDKAAQELVYKIPVTTRQNTDIPWIEIDTTEGGERVCPGAIGGVQWNGPAFNPRTNALYVPAVDWCSMTRDPVEESRGWLTSIDASTGEIRWQYESQRPMLAAVTTTSSDLVFTGEMTGDFIALDARNGSELFRFYTGGPMIGGVATYSVDGKQYVTAASGGTNAFWRSAPGSATIVVFALP